MDSLEMEIVIVGMGAIEVIFVGMVIETGWGWVGWKRNLWDGWGWNGNWMAMEMKSVGMDEDGCNFHPSAGLLTCVHQ